MSRLGSRSRVRSNVHPTLLQSTPKLCSQHRKTGSSEREVLHVGFFPQSIGVVDLLNLAVADSPSIGSLVLVDLHEGRGDGVGVTVDLVVDTRCQMGVLSEQ